MVCAHLIALLPLALLLLHIVRVILGLLAAQVHDLGEKLDILQASAAICAWVLQHWCHPALFSEQIGSNATASGCKQLLTIHTLAFEPYLGTQQSMACPAAQASVWLRRGTPAVHQQGQEHPVDNSLISAQCLGPVSDITQPAKTS